MESQAWPLDSRVSREMMEPQRRSQSESERSVCLSWFGWWEERWRGVVGGVWREVELWRWEARDWLWGRWEEDFDFARETEDRDLRAPETEAERLLGPGERERRRGVVGADLPWR